MTETTEEFDFSDIAGAIARSKRTLVTTTYSEYSDVLRLFTEWLNGPDGKPTTMEERQQICQAILPHLKTSQSRQRLLEILQQASAPSSGTVALFGQAGTPQTGTGVDANHPVVRQLIGLQTTNKTQFDWLMDIFLKTIRLGQTNPAQAAKVTTLLNNVIADANKPNGDFAVGDDPSSLGGVNLAIVTELRQKNDDLDQKIGDLNQKLSAAQAHVLATAEAVEAYIWHVGKGQAVAPPAGVNQLRDDQDALYRLVGITHRPGDGSPVPAA
ncbi:MAG TPA: hypothetical protein VFO38_00120 [Candidatus Saccharimonadales bacterium]|nr:hypothetical protein [Candidatus Saccharimonadales bacterium]